jgi:glycosyltransferase involved in cell wall biosynthesis
MSLKIQDEFLDRQSKTSARSRVSVICTTYNHEAFIRETLDSFICQKTNFPFEIIVHDDASTDATPEILREYMAKYPQLFRVYLRKENRYQKGGFKPLVFASSLSNADYVALCEGDDFWLSDNKLQLQYDALAQHPDVDFCFHSAYLLSEDGRKEIRWNYKHNKIFHCDSVLECSTGSFAPTSSYMLRRKVLMDMPSWFHDYAPVGDFFIEMYGTKHGGALYLDAPMSVYRYMTPGSWTVSTNANNEIYDKYAESLVTSVARLEADFPGHAKSIRRKKAWLYAHFAVQCLLIGRKDAYKCYIKKSFREKMFISKKQIVAYALRFSPGLVTDILRLSRGC